MHPTRSPSHRASLLLPFLLLLLLLVYSFLTLSSSSHHPPAAAHRLFLSLSPGANATIAAHLRALTLRPHLAGTPSAATAASYVLAHLRASGLRTLTADYFPLLSYPASASLSLLRPDGSLLKHLPLTEPADTAAASVPPYHAYSPSGSALAPAVYVNYGHEDDYRTLDRLGVQVKGRIVIARRGEGSRASVVVRAQERGAVAVLMYKVADGGGVERGTVLLGGIGDPLTPGWVAPHAAQHGGGERLGANDEEVRRRFPSIPSMPLAEAVAVEILRTLGGPSMPSDWRENLPFGADTGVGPGPSLVNFTYQVIYTVDGFNYLLVDGCK